MLTRRTKRVAVRPELVGDALRPLPLPLVLAVAGCLPADDKLRLAFVSPAFRAVADETRLYQDVRLGDSSGVGRASDALLRAVSAKARGTMRTLDVSGRTGGVRPAVTRNAVLAVCEANTGTLEAVDVRCEDDPGGCPVSDFFHTFDHAGIARLLAALPRLRRLDADLLCTLAQLQALLLQHAGVLRVRRLRVWDLPDAAAVTALVAAVEAQPSVSQLGLYQAPLHTAALLDAVVGLSLARRLGALMLDSCRLGAASMPALTRLLGREGGLVSLAICDDGDSIEILDNGDEIEIALPPSPAFCAALRASALQRLDLSKMGLFDDPDAGIALLAAVTGHHSLRLLSVRYSRVAAMHCAAVGAALGALVASNAPSLTSLDVSGCWLGNAGLAPLVAALAGNTALRSLDIRRTDTTRRFGVALLAAVGANTGLRKLKAIEVGTGWPETAEAEALVAARA